MKKSFSFFLALVMVLSLFSGLTVTASAEDDGKVWTLIGDANAIATTPDIGTVTITMTTSDGNTFALHNGNGASKAPIAVPVTINGNTMTIVDTDTYSNSQIGWTIEAADEGYIIRSAADSETWLYSTNANNGVRVGTNAANVWDVDSASGYLKHIGTGRYLGVYNNADWRAYTNTTGNTAGQTLQFWLLTDAGAVHEHEWGAWTSNNNGTHSRTCQEADCPIGSQTENCSYDEGVVTTEPTCVEEGEKEYTCDMCGYSYTEAIPATGEHTDADGDGFCDVCGEAMPVPRVFTLGSELHEGDQVVIYSPYGSQALSVNASGTRLAGTAASISGEELTVQPNDTDTAVLTVEYDGATNFYLKTADGKYLTSPATGNGLNFAAASSEYALWNLTVASESDKTVYITNANAKYNNLYQMLEYYNNAFTAYGNRTAAAYQFKLYIIANPDAHVHDWDEGTVTTEPTCTSKGVMTYTCSGCDESYTEPIPMIPHADGDEDGYCDGCEGVIYHEAETLNDGDRLILVTGAFGKAMTGTETENGGYLASADVNAQAGVTVPAGDDNVWTVKTADEGFYLLNSEGQYLYVNESSKLALGDEDSNNILWTVGAAVEGLEPTGAYLYNPGAEKYIEYGKNYDNYQTYGAPTANYETWYAFTFYTLPAEPLPEAGFTLSPTEITLEGFDENGDLSLPFVAETLTFGTVEGDEGPFVPGCLHIEFYAGSLSCGAESISFQIYAGGTSGHWGTGNSYGFDLLEQGQEKSILLFIEPSVLSGAAPGLYTGTMSYTSVWQTGDGEDDAEGPSGTIALTLTVPEPETLDDGFYLLVAHGDEGWGVEFINPEQKFEPNGNNQGEYLLSTALAVEDEIKVVRVENGAITGWWPNGEGTQYHVDAAHSGNVTIYFKTDYVNDWAQFGGYFYIGSLLKPDSYADVYGCSISLKGNIGLNFYLIASETLLADGDAYVTLGDKTIKFSEITPRTVGEDTLYPFSVKLHAKQMNDSIVLKVYDGEGDPVALYRSSNDEDLTETGYSYSVMDYIEKTRETSSDAKLLALVNAMADYGILAQIQFNYNTGDLPSVQGDLDSVTAETVAAYEKKVTDGAAAGVSFKGGTLVLQSETAIRLYFNLDEGEIGDYTFKLGKSVKTPVETNDGWMIEIPNISAKDLDKTYTVVVSGGEGTVLTVKYSALSYAYSVLSGDSKSDSLINLVKGIVLYNQAANAYFGS